MSARTQCAAPDQSCYVSLRQRVAKVHGSATREIAFKCSAVQMRVESKSLIYTLRFLGHVGFELSTERRAAQRADWDRWKEEKEKKETEKRLERDRRLQKEMEDETKRLRQLTVHKAQPVPQFVKSRHGVKSSCDKENISGNRQNVKQ